MWPRKQLDIGWVDFAYAAAQVLWPGGRPADGEVAKDWLRPEETLVSLSVRSAWDLLLATLRLPAGSEVIMSAVTVPDMARIVDYHGLVAVPVDVDAARLQPALAEIEKAITPQTRVIIVAHLFGSRMDMGPIVELASKHNLLVVEDCAQAYLGPAYAGHADSDVCLFSFGPIKTATALGGAVTRVRDGALLAEMRRRQSEYRVQTRRSYLSRILRFIGIRLFTTRLVYSAAVGYCRRRGIDYDRKIAGLARSFSADRLFELIRRQPSTPLVKMVQWRIATFDGSTSARLRRRVERSARVAGRLAVEQVIGGENTTHTYWVFPIRTSDDAVLLTLREAGFDATRLSSLVIVPCSTDAAGERVAATRECEAWLRETVFLPYCDSMPEAEIERMAALIANVVPQHLSLPEPAREPAARPRVSVAP